MKKLEALAALLLATAVIFLFMLLVSNVNYLRAEQEQNAADLQRMKQEIEETEAYIDELQLFMDKLNIAEFEATAYSPHDDQNGLNSWAPPSRSAGYQVRTRTGTVPRQGTIAVDPAVIPLGRKVWVEGQGWCKAEDTGGQIKGNRIDIYHATYEAAMEYGRQKVTAIWAR